MPTAGQSGALTALAIDTIASPAVAFNFQSAGIQQRRVIFDPNNIRGSRSHQSEQTRFGNSAFNGPIKMFPSKAEWLKLLPWILSGSGTSPFSLGDVPATRYVQQDTGTKVFTYAGCVVNRATIEAREGEAVALSLDVMGISETMTNSGTGTGTSLGAASPMMFTDGAYTLLSVARRFKNFTVTIDNHCVPVYNNSVTPTYILSHDRTISVVHNTPFTADETDLYNMTLTGTNGATFNLTNGGDNLLLTFATIQYPSETPSIPGKTEIPLVMNGIARKLTTTQELVVTCS